MKPLKNIQILEFAGLGPAPFAAMILADMGANVTRVSRLPIDGTASKPVIAVGTFLNRGRKEVFLDLKSAKGAAKARALAKKADVLIEGYRPGKMESLGLGPQELMALNHRLVYGRMTGWGQTGPMAHLAGHDINFLGLSGILNTLGEKDRPPVPPLNLIGDFGGGGMYLAFGIASALLRARETGCGAIVDTAMIQGVTHLASFVHGQRAQGRWQDERQNNLIDGGAPFYRCYETSDNRYMAVGALEPVFFGNLLAVLELTKQFLPYQNNRAIWPEMIKAFECRFAEHSFKRWVKLFENVDACVTPVLNFDEASRHPQMVDCYEQRDGVMQPSSTPKLLSPIVDK